MTRLLLPLLALLALFFPWSVSAQTPPPAPVPVAPAPKNNHLYGKITAADAAHQTITVTANGKFVVVALTPTIRIFKMADKRGMPTGSFADLAVGAEISVHLTDASAGTEAPVADEIRVRKAAPRA